MKRTSLALALAALLPLGAQAAELDYSYIEAGYNRIDAHGSDADADGPAINTSVALGESFFLYGGYSANDIDDSPADVDVSRIGLGWRHGLASGSDLLVKANYIKADVGGVPINLDAEGYEAEVGLRTAHGDNFESYVALGWQDGGDFDGDVYATLGGQYKFNPAWGIAASATHRDGANEFFVGPRFSF